MTYNSFSLNGAWEMSYSPTVYTEKINPFDPKMHKTYFSSEKALIQNAVPGFWEDMTESFLHAPFFKNLKINPEYGLWQYPISGTCPDMALPNIMGNFIYRCSFDCEDISLPSSIHFCGVQNTVSVWINDTYLGTHKGYSAPFEIEIKDGVLKEKDNIIVLSLSNLTLEGYDSEPVSGLTSRAANEYSGGITGDIELWQYTSPLRDAVVLISKDTKTASVTIESVAECSFTWEIRDGQKIIKAGKATGDFEFETTGLDLWSPDAPKLYTLSLFENGNIMERTFAVRVLTADESKLYLNSKPIFMRGVCEHCYFPETLHQVHDINYYKSMIRKFKELGFNYIRFHTYVPFEEYMQAADELGMMIHVESPNNTSFEEWKEIVRFCRRHPSVVIYCCGNELQMDDAFIKHLSKCADEVHENTDSLFAPMSAMRGLEYCFIEPDMENRIKHEPFEHCPDRLKTVGDFSDVYASYTNGHHSYRSTGVDIKAMDKWHEVYKKPRLSHEICIDGTYTDLSLEGRYEGLRVGKTQMFSSLRAHLKKKGVLSKAPLYFQNSSKWQARVRKHCFESLRLSRFIAGYDFLGPIDTHWHTFGYDVGMMNEFYELKPGETVKNVLMYNSGTVILTDLEKKTNFTLGKEFKTKLLISHYGKDDIYDAKLTLRLFADGKVWEKKEYNIPFIKNGDITEVSSFDCILPIGENPVSMKLCATLDFGDEYSENEWELYAFPERATEDTGSLCIMTDCESDDLTKELEAGKNVVLFGSKPFDSVKTTFKIALAGRTEGNLATVIYDHPLMNNMPHGGFCSWQFAPMIENGNAVCFETEDVPFNPIIEMVSTHKNVIRESCLFEFEALNGKLLVCSLNIDADDPGAKWFKNEIITYAKSDSFMPKDYIDNDGLDALINTLAVKSEANKNFAFNANDKTATRKNKN